MRIAFLFAWYDLWIGMFYDKKKNWLYILPIPMLGIIIKLPQKRYWLVSNRDNKTITGSTTRDELEYYSREDNAHGKLYWAKNGSTEPWISEDFINED